MKHWKFKLLTMLVAVLACAGVAAAENGEFCDAPSAGLSFGPSATSQVATQGQTLQAQRAERESLYQWLLESHGQPAAVSISVPLSLQDRIDLGLERCDGCTPIQTDPRKHLVGANKSVDQSVDFADLPFAAAQRRAVAFAGGHARPNADGLGWSTTIASPDASAVRLMFRDLNLPDGAALFVYNDQGEAFGPYLGQAGGGEVWTHTVSGEAITVAVQFFGPVDRATVARSRFEIADIVHLGPEFRLGELLSPAPQSGNGHCSYNESCVEDASCYGSNDFAYIDDARLAAGHMLFSSGPWAYVCSGGLMADTIGSQTPYFITANHCISRDREATSLEAYFQYMTSSCGATCPNRGNFPRTLGSSILSTNSTSDYTLLLLSQQPPSGSVFLGWTSSEVAFTSNYSLYRISHPSGAPQAFSTHRVDTSAGTCTSWPRGPWIYSDDNIGATEGGSSGSPVLNASGQVVGMLSGACGFNVNDVCDSDSNSTVDGALAHFFDAVSPWLAPDGGGDPDPGDPDPGDPDPGDPDPTDGTMSVASISLNVRAQGPWRTGQATVTIRDQDGNAVGGATVTGTFSGNVSGSDSNTTGSNGSTLLQSNRVRQNSISFTFCVDSVSHPDFDYVSGDNAVTCLSN
jgi:lysyl endopeptidase